MYTHTHSLVKMSETSVNALECVLFHQLLNVGGSKKRINVLNNTIHYKHLRGKASIK